MNQLTISSLISTDLSNVTEAFEKAFCDYNTHFPHHEIESLLRRRGYNPALSFAAFDGDKIAAFILNGRGVWRGLPTVYDTGTGTLPDYRGQRLTRRLFDYSLPILQEAGIAQYLLEVVTDNVKALSIYRKAGFETERELFYYNCRPDMLKWPSSLDDISTETLSISRSSVAQLSRYMESWADFTPTWQNSIDSLRRAGGDVIALKASYGEECVGVCVTDPTSGDISFIAVRPDYRRRGIATRLLREVAGSSRSAVIKAINIPVDSTPLQHFLVSRGLIERGRQYEMLLRL